MLSEGLLGKTPSQTAGPHARGTVDESGGAGKKMILLKLSCSESSISERQVRSTVPTVKRLRWD